MTLIEFLTWAGSVAGIPVVIGFVESFVVEWWPGFAEWDAKWKRLFTMAAFILVIPGVATLGRWLTGGFPATVHEAITVELWNACQAGFIAWAGSQGMHLTGLPQKLSGRA